MQHDVHYIHNVHDVRSRRIRRKTFAQIAFLDLPSKKRNVDGTGKLMDSPFRLSRELKSITAAVATLSKRKGAQDIADLASLEMVPVVAKIQNSVRESRDFSNVDACASFMARDQECLQNDRRFGSGMIEAASLVLRLQQFHDAILQFHAVRKTGSKNRCQSPSAATEAVGIERRTGNPRTVFQPICQQLRLEIFRDFLQRFGVNEGRTGLRCRIYAQERSRNPIVQFVATC